MSELQTDFLAISTCLIKVSISDIIAIYLGDTGTILSIINLIFLESKI